MPGHSNRTAARKPRKSALGRKARPGAVRPRQQAAPAVPAVIGASFASLKLEPLAGADVYCRLTGVDSPGKPESLFNDLAASWKAAIENWQFIGGEWTVMPWGLYGKTPGHAISHIMEDFEQRFCDGSTGYIVSERDGRYYFTLLREYDHPAEWLVFETRKLLASVKHVSRPLYELTLAFLVAFMDRAGVPSWFNGGMEYAEDWLEESLSQQQLDGFTEYQTPKEAEREFEKAKQDLMSFRVGKSAACAIQIKRARKMGPEDIQKALKRIRVEHPIKAAIETACELMAAPYTIGDFDVYYHIEDDDNSSMEGLLFHEQFLMLYEYDNALTSEHQDWIDSKANAGGVMSPVMSYAVMPDREDWSRERFDNAGNWIEQLVVTFRLLADAAIYKKPANKKSK